MDSKTEDEINNLILQITKGIKAREIYLFGSFAHGNPGEDSDIDLCILTDKGNRRKLDILREIRELIAPIMSKPVDVIVYNPDEFYERASLRSTIEYKIKTEGIKVYG